MHVRGIRSVEIEMCDPDRAAEFYAKVWHLTEIDSVGGAHYLRATGAYHHVLAIHRAAGKPFLRRIVFDVADRSAVDRLHRSVSAASVPSELPHAIDRPGGGYGFGFADPEGRNLAAVCDVADHRDHRRCPADRPRKICPCQSQQRRPPGDDAGSSDVLGFALIDETAALTSSSAPTIPTIILPWWRAATRARPSTTWPTRCRTSIW